MAYALIITKTVILLITARKEDSFILRKKEIKGRKKV